MCCFGLNSKNKYWINRQNKMLLREIFQKLCEISHKNHALVTFLAGAAALPAATTGLVVTAVLVGATALTGAALAGAGVAFLVGLTGAATTLGASTTTGAALAALAFFHSATNFSYSCLEAAVLTYL